MGHLPQLFLLSQLMEFDLLKESDFPVAGGLLVEVILSTLLIWQIARDVRNEKFVLFRY